MARPSDRATVRAGTRLLGLFVFVGICIAGLTFTGAVAVAATSMTGTRAPARLAPRSAAPVDGALLSSGRVVTRGLPVFVFGDYQGRRPHTIAFSGDAGNIVGGLKWSNWTRSHATGTGTSYVQGCIPDCATGAEILVPTLITLREPIAGAFTRIIERRDGQTETFIYTRRPAPRKWPQIERGPRLAGPAVSLEDYWGDIDTGTYAKAWTYLASAGNTQAAFVQNEQEAKPTNIQLFGTLLSITGDRARVDLKRLTTHDDQYGCRTWTGYYEMVQTDGKWLIDQAHITPTAC